MSALKTEQKLFLLGGIVDDQMFTPQGIKKCVELPSILTQHLVLSRTLTQSQSQLQERLLHCQQNLRTLIKSLPI